jgi:hypothetical protein
MYLFQEFFFEENPDREQEYIFCLQKNISNSLIKKIFLLIDENEYNRHADRFENILEYLSSDKVVYIKHNDTAYLERITFNKLLFDIVPEFVKSGQIAADSIIIISNLDIFFTETDDWKNLDKDF